MSEQHSRLLFIGTYGHVRAVDKFTGGDYWTTDLPGTGYDIVTLLYESGLLFAGSKGYVFALEPTTGKILWKNELRGLNYNHMTLATAVQSVFPHIEAIAKSQSDTTTTNNNI